MLIVVTVLLLLLLVWLLYSLYRKFVCPPYTPGCVRLSLASSPQTFDSASLIAESTPNRWYLPDRLSLYHFAVPESPTPISDPIHVICVSGGPSVAVSKPWKLCEDQALLSAGVLFHHFHPRGTGQSTKPFDKFPSTSLFKGIHLIEQTLGLQAQVSDLERIRCRLPAEKVTIIGHSFGALIATFYAAEFPEHVSSLILLSPASVLKVPPPPEADLFQTVRERLRTEEEKRELDQVKGRLFDFRSLSTKSEQDMVQLQSDVAELYFKVNPTSARITEERGDLVGGWASMASYMSLGMRADFAAQLKPMLSKVQFPTLIICGSEDIFDPALSDQYIFLFPPSLVTRRVLRCGHEIQDEVPDELAACISSVIRH